MDINGNMDINDINVGKTMPYKLSPRKNRWSSGIFKNIPIYGRFMTLFYPQ